MKYHDRMGEGWWEARNYKHDNLVTGVLSNFDFLQHLLPDNDQHKLQYNTTEIQQNKVYCCAD
jgi:hypothetical protein